MTQTLSAEFDTRRDAEMTVEHLVQEYGLDRKSISIFSVSQDNSAGTKVAGSDLEDGHPKHDIETSPALSSKIRVSVEAEDEQIDNVRNSFSSYNGK